MIAEILEHWGLASDAKARSLLNLCHPLVERKSMQVLDRFNAMLLSDLAVIGRLAISAGNKATTSIGLEEIVNYLHRACTSTSYTCLYSLEVLHYLEETARAEPNGFISVCFEFP